MEYAYMCTSPLTNCVKVGRWSHLLHGLITTHESMYGPDLYIIIFECDDASGLKRNFKEYFGQYHLSLDLYEKSTDLMVKYIDYCMKHAQQFFMARDTPDQNYHEHYLNAKSKNFEDTV
jgi:hypothetical protein